MQVRPTDASRADVDQHLAGAGRRVRHLLDPDVSAAVEEGCSHLDLARCRHMMLYTPSVHGKVRCRLSTACQARSVEMTQRTLRGFAFVSGRDR
jgi:hypothetical protein